MLPINNDSNAIIIILYDIAYAWNLHEAGKMTDFLYKKRKLRTMRQELGLIIAENNLNQTCIIGCRLVKCLS